MASKKSKIAQQQQNAAREIQQAQQRTTGDSNLPSHSRQTSVGSQSIVVSPVIHSATTYSTGLAGSSSDVSTATERRVNNVCLSFLSLG